MCAVITIIVILILFLPATGRITPRMAMNLRKVSLAKWHLFVKSYIGDTNRVPTSLFEVCQAKYRKGEKTFPQHIYLANDEFLRSYDELLRSYPPNLTSDPNLFEKEVPYGLFLGTNGWYIIELKAGLVYKKSLMIDQDGKIYELRATEQEPFKSYK